MFWILINFKIMPGNLMCLIDLEKTHLGCAFDTKLMLKSVFLIEKFPGY